MILKLEQNINSGLYLKFLKTNFFCLEKKIGANIKTALILEKSIMIETVLHCSKFNLELLIYIIYMDLHKPYCSFFRTARRIVFPDYKHN